LFKPQSGGTLAVLRLARSLEELTVSQFLLVWTVLN